jgi:SAM-dependent methyltransferase
MAKLQSSLLLTVANYYADKLAHYGATPSGVDWNGVDGQFLRFNQLAKVLSPDIEKFSVSDLGCGYGALYDFLASDYLNFEYEGVDVAASMVDTARRLHAVNPKAKFHVGSEPTAVKDFCIASGIFNVKLTIPFDQWTEYIINTLTILDAYSTKGFSFNCLSKYSDIDRMRDDLYYADPLMLFDICKKKFSKNVSLLHDYDLYEFTILVKKP